ncbi:hypothetical protein QBC40DRAFT_278261 [Triangularia verruculosa]|uniref:YCII-related domain-containing protein n=1 Tax=Triangularia verruculosa TaxID=2587418 RepID=A0AAN6XJJ0_9PEZI|nr:hypothetical protein QBC40DRAFT_278261 [Triangularia verruculosa]
MASLLRSFATTTSSSSSSSSTFNKLTLLNKSVLYRRVRSIAVPPHNIRTHQQPIRTMTSTEIPHKIEWLVVVPDFPGAHEKRLEVRPQHFGALRPAVDAGVFKMGGAVLNEPPQGADPAKFSFAGSTIVISASSREEIKELLRGDVYAKEGVWDVENAQMWPFLCAFRFPVPGQEEKFPDPRAKQ